MMIDWYEEGLANLEFEKEMIERYAGRKLEYRIWQERANRILIVADSRLELLRRLLDQDVIWADPMCGCEDCDLIREVEQEVARHNERPATTLAT